MKKYDVYGIGAAIVDTEVIVSDSFLNDNEIGKGLMTLVDEKRQEVLSCTAEGDRIHACVRQRNPKRHLLTHKPTGHRC